MFFRMRYFCQWFCLPLLLVGVAAGGSLPRFENLSVDNGLSQDSVNKVIEDATGFIWLATQEGLNRFDGYQFKVYKNRVDDRYSLMHDFVNTMMVDLDGRLWVGTASGLDRYDPETDGFIHHIPPGPFDGRPQSPSVSALTQDEMGTIWVGTWGGGLHRFVAGEGFAARFSRGAEFGLDQDFIADLHYGGNGRIWIALSGAGLLGFDIVRSRFRHYPYQGGDADGPGDNRLTVIREDAGGRLWLGGYSGIDIFDPNTHRFEPFRPGGEHGDLLETAAVTDLLFGKAGSLWVATVNQGLFLLNLETGGTEHYPARADGLKDDHVKSLYMDRGGILWAGGAYYGLYRHDPAQRRIRHLSSDPFEKNSLIHPCVNASVQAPDGTFYFGSPQGLTQFDPRNARFRRFDKPRDLGGQGVMALSFLEDDLWIGTSQGGITILSPEGTFTRLGDDGGGLPARMAHNQVWALAPDQAGNMWAGTGQGLNRYASGSGEVQVWKNQRQEPSSLSNNDVRVLYFSRNSDLWLGTMGGGLNRMELGNPDHFFHFRADKGISGSLSDDRVMCIAEDLEGHLWVGTSSGLNRYEGDHFTVYDERNGLKSDFISSILVDGRDRLWLATHRGLACLDQDDGTIRTLDEEDGLLNTEYIYGAGLVASNGEMFFGGVLGVDYFFPNVMSLNTVPPPVVITDLILMNDYVPIRREDPDSPITKPISQLDTLRLTHRDYVFSLEFSALHYANAAQNRYAYQLEGVDEQWVSTDAQHRRATYTRLSPGHYVFRVKGANKDGVWSTEDAVLQIDIMPPFWATWWAVGFYIFSLVCAVLLVIRGRYEALKRLNRELADQVKHRTTEVEHQKEVVECQNARLENQNALLAGQKREIETQAERLSDLFKLKSRFFANISHEFRTPLTLSIGPLEDILAGSCGPVNEQMAQRLEVMLRNNRRLLGLINQLLDVTKLEAGELKLQLTSADLAHFVSDHVLSFAPQAERVGVNLNFESGVEPLPAVFDQVKMEDILDNLLSNAFKFTGRGGCVSVKVWRQRQEAYISVKDTGQGIPAEILPFVFERFYQGKDKVVPFSASSGIGLSLVKDLVGLHGGRIEVDSSVGEGSEFIVAVPIKAVPDRIETGEEFHPGVREVPEISFNTCKPTSKPRHGRDLVLVIDDNGDIRRYLGGILEDLYDVVEAANGEDGLGLARKLIPDMIICDIMMPGPNGFEVCGELKADQQTSHIPVILLTALATEPNKIKGLKLGADDYLIKPFNAREVHLRVDNLIEGRKRLQAFYSKGMLVERSILTAADDGVSASMEDAFILRAVEIVEKRMSKAHFGVAELAEEIGLSRRQLLRKITALTGSSPTDFLRRIRLEKAALMLKQRNGNISEVAYAVGFETPAHFSKLFRKHFGMLPREYMAGRPQTTIRS